MYRIQYRDPKDKLIKTHKYNINKKQDAIDEVIFLNFQSKVKYWVST